MRFPMLISAANQATACLHLCDNRVHNEHKVGVLCRAIGKSLKLVVFGAALTGSLQLNAQSIAAVDANIDAAINVWVDRAPFALFVTELAANSGLQASIETSLVGQVSGRFKGRLNDTLAVVGSQLGLLFDVDKNTLHVVPESTRSNASIALNDVQLDEADKQQLTTNLLPGNTVDLRDDVVLVSGHPVFVRRTARRAATAVSLAEQAQSELSKTLALDILKSESEVLLEAQAELIVETEVIDNAARVMVQDLTELEPEAQQVQSASGRIEWVTDIPGFDTF